MPKKPGPVPVVLDHTKAESVAAMGATNPQIAAALGISEGTLIAAEISDRVCYGMEIDPKYCDVIIKRYADYAKVDEAAIRATREAA